jgi:hypothetical protein
MNKEKLYRLCGIDAVITKAKKPKWVSAQLRFLGAERYVLGVKTVEVSVVQKDAGISLMFRHPLTIEASSLLGKRKRSGLLIDVDVVMGDVTMRLASMNKGMYPIVLRNDETVVLI